jgi:hypothetical protein
VSPRGVCSVAKYSRWVCRQYRGDWRETEGVGECGRCQECKVQQKRHRCDRNVHKDSRGLEGVQHQQIDCHLLAGDGLGRCAEGCGWRAMAGAGWLG